MTDRAYIFIDELEEKVDDIFENAEKNEKMT